MDALSEEQMRYLCKSLAKAAGTPVRLCRAGSPRFSELIYPLDPDPVTPYLSRLLAEPAPAGVFTTPTGQNYGYAAISGGWHILVGPSRMEYPDDRLVKEQLFRLGIPAAAQAEYLHALNCFPLISAGRMGWLMVFLVSALEGTALPFDRLDFHIPPGEHRSEVQSRYLNTRESDQWQNPDQLLVERGQQFEKLLLSYIQKGDSEQVQALLEASPAIQAGKMSEDSLRQLKNAGICAAAVASRAAIAGGMDEKAAFRMSDLYIQKIELLEDASALKKLQNDMIIDYAEAVRRVRYRVTPGENAAAQQLFRACADYVARHIYEPIRVDEMADALGYSRGYLSSSFKRQTGLTLTQYILQEKVFEAQRMLEFSGESLMEIANLFSFSSQSHFQNVFKKVTGQTPMEYRRLHRK